MVCNRFLILIIIEIMKIKVRYNSKTSLVLGYYPEDVNYINDKIETPFKDSCETSFKVK